MKLIFLLYISTDSIKFYLFIVPFILNFIAFQFTFSHIKSKLLFCSQSTKQNKKEKHFCAFCFNIFFSVSFTFQSIQLHICFYFNTKIYFVFYAWNIFPFVILLSCYIFISYSICEGLRFPLKSTVIRRIYVYCCCWSHYFEYGTYDHIEIK